MEFIKTLVKVAVFCACVFLIVRECASSSLQGDGISRVLTPSDTVEAPAATCQDDDDAALSASPHLKFKGVPIDGTLKAFVRRMKRKGFRVSGSGDGTARLEGDFAGSKECTVLVSTIEGKDLVCTITVLFADQDKWADIYADYSNLKELLTEKYGKPASCVEKFQSATAQGDDYMKMVQVELSKCNYQTVFCTAAGTVALSISHEGARNCAKLVYADKTNSASVRQHALDDL